MQAHKIKVIPSLFLATDYSTWRIIEKFNQQLESMGMDSYTQCIRVTDIKYLDKYLTEPVKNDYNKLDLRYSIHDAWQNKDNLGHRVVLLASRSWLDDLRKKEQPLNFDHEYKPVLIIFEDQDKYNEKDFWCFFKWISELEWIEHCWWIDNQTKHIEVSKKDRELQTISFLHSITWDEVAGYLSNSEYVSSRNLKGSFPDVIGSFRIYELSLEPMEVLKLLCSLYIETYLYPNEVSNETLVMSEFSDIQMHYDINNLKDLLCKIFKEILLIKNSSLKINYLNKFITWIKEKTLFLESGQDKVWLENNFKRFDDALNKFKKPIQYTTMPSPSPPQFAPFGMIMGFWLSIIIYSISYLSDILPVNFNNSIWLWQYFASLITGCFIGLIIDYIIFYYKKNNPFINNNFELLQKPQLFFGTVLGGWLSISIYAVVYIIGIYPNFNTVNWWGIYFINFIIGSLIIGYLIDFIYWSEHLYNFINYIQEKHNYEKNKAKESKYNNKSKIEPAQFYNLDNTDNKIFSDKIPDDLTEKIELLSRWKNLLENYYNSLKNDNRPFIIKDIEILKNMLTQDQEKLNEWFCHFGKNKFMEWIDILLQEMTVDIEKYHTWQSLYLKWLDQIFKHSDIENTINYEVIKDIHSEVIQNLVTLTQDPSLIWRIDETGYNAKCLLINSLQENIEHFENVVKIETSIPNQIKIIHIGQYRTKDLII
ncbi:membrane hypothetical protein [Candidatus Magnetomoraceae bacterium gMMP-15]